MITQRSLSWFSFLTVCGKYPALMGPVVWRASLFMAGEVHVLNLPTWKNKGESSKEQNNVSTIHLPLSQDLFVRQQPWVLERRRNNTPNSTIDVWCHFVKRYQYCGTEEVTSLPYTLPVNLWAGGEQGVASRASNLPVPSQLHTLWSFFPPKITRTSLF